MNVLKPHLQVTVKTLLVKGISQREISRKTGVESGQNPPPWPPDQVSKLHKHARSDQRQFYFPFGDN